MRRTRWSAVSLALLAACTRDLSVPPARTLAVSPAFSAAAPREAVRLRASGGAAPYSAAFAQGGQLSGPDAAVAAVAGDPGAFTYCAGSLGAAQDLVEIRDAAGAVATVRLSVGARLRVTPALTVTAPGGRATLVASGGKPPYTFRLEAAQPGTELRAAQDGDADAREVVVGPEGDRTERVVVTDQTLDPLAAGSSASAEALVQVSGAVRLYANAPAEVPPHETVDFLAVGGQPPYEFDFVGSTAASGGSVDLLSGRYVAGPVGAADGSVVDRVVVRDALGQRSAPWPLAVGAPLRLELPTANLSPGVPVELAASGGKPPYTFGFARRGNRSAGDVNAASGTYTPGANQGTGDLLQVWDATGVASFVLSEPSRVGYAEIPVGAATGRAVEARLRGDRRPDNDAPRQDVLLSHYDSGAAAGLTAVLLPPDVPPRLASGYVSQLDGTTFAVDLDGDAHDEIVGLGPSGLVVLEPDAFGNLSVARVEGPTALNRVTRGAMPGSTVTFFTATACTCTSDGAATTWPQYACARPTAATYAGTYRVDFVAGSTVPRWTCDLPPQDGTATSLQAAGALAAGDLDGDGEVDLAWAQGPNVYVSHRVGGLLGSAQPVYLPCPLLSPPVHQSDGRLVAYRRMATPTDTKVFLVASILCGGPAAPRQDVARIDSTVGRVPFLSPAGAVDLGRPVYSTPSIRAASASAGAPQHVLMFGGNVYDVTGVAFDAAGLPTVFAALPRPMPSSMQWVALPDVNGDQIPDLLTAGTNQIVRLMLGDGDGRFGWRARFRQLRNWGVGDVDGDGLDDVAGADNTPAITLGYGGGHQLAWASPRVVPAGAGAFAVGKFDAGPEIVHIEFTGPMLRSRVNPDGSLQAAERVALTGALPQSLRVLRGVDFGGDGRTDFWLTSPNQPSVAGVILMDSRLAGTYRVLSAPSGYLSCATLPAGTGEAAWPVELASVCPIPDLPDAQTIRVYRRSFDAGAGAYTAAWLDVTPASFLPAEGGTSTGSVLGAGTWDGKAWFVVVPYGADPGRHRYLVGVAPGRTHADPFTVTKADLGPASALTVKSALVGDVDGVDLLPEVVLLGGGALVVLRPDGLGGAAEVARTRADGASIDGVLRLGPGPERDVLIRAADDGIVVRNRGGVSLE